jgi:Glutathione peroxidase
MRKIFFSILALLVNFSMSQAASLNDFTLTGIDGKPMAFSQFKGSAVLLVNTASECGFTGQYDGLEKLWETYRDKGLVIVGVPSNDFGGQEPGKAEEIATFCKLNYGWLTRRWSKASRPFPFMCGPLNSQDCWEAPNGISTNTCLAVTVSLLTGSLRPRNP